MISEGVNCEAFTQFFECKGAVSNSPFTIRLLGFELAWSDHSLSRLSFENPDISQHSSFLGSAGYSSMSCHAYLNEAEFGLVNITAPAAAIPDYGRTFSQDEPTLKHCGWCPCSYVARDLDGGGVSSEAWVHVLVRSPEYWANIMKNVAPEAIASSFTMDQGGVLLGSLQASDDFDSLQQLTFAITQMPLKGVLSIVASEFKYEPDPEVWGDDAFTFQVTDGMGLSSEAIVRITIRQINLPPRLACDELNTTLFTSPLALHHSLQHSNGYPSQAEPLVGSDLAQAMGAAARIASDVDPGELLLRTSALNHLAEVSDAGALLFGPGAYDLVCTAHPTWDLQMIDNTDAVNSSAYALRGALLAFDPDEDQQLEYVILKPPSRGVLRVSTALPASSGFGIQVGSPVPEAIPSFVAEVVDGPNATFAIGVPGHPLFFEYLPNPLIRGEPADYFTWAAVDRFGSSSTPSVVEINVQCSPGFMIDPVASPSACISCSTGTYNLPDLTDQLKLVLKVILKSYLCRPLLERCWAKRLGPDKSKSSSSFVYDAVQETCIRCPKGTACGKPAMTAPMACSSGSYQ
eukprot:scaffold165009_cov42-Prasinocladus_malaysianus.AAC.1